jgi:hypothetical protein
MISIRRDLATRKNQLEAISEFANMGGAPDRWSAFQRRWSTLLPPEVFERSLKEIQQNEEWAKHPKDEEWAKHTELAGPPWQTTLRFGESHLQRNQIIRNADGRYVEYRHPRVLHLRDLVREAWRGGTGANECMVELLGLRSPSDEIHASWSAPFSADWHRGQLVYRSGDPFQQACHALLENSQLAKFCANPDCLAPYFIARRATQRYCSPECLKPFQKQAKLDWWNTNRKGKLRKAKSAQGRKKRS